MNRFTEGEFWEAVSKFKHLPTKTSYPIPTGKSLPTISHIELIDHEDIYGILLRGVATPPCGKLRKYFSVHIDDTSILDDHDFWERLVNQIVFTDNPTE